MADESGIDGSSSDRNLRPRIEISRWSRDIVPSYFKNFLDSYGGPISTLLAAQDKEGLRTNLQQFAKMLPQDSSFKEMAGMVCRRQDGSLYVSVVEGKIDEIS